MKNIQSTQISTSNQLIFSRLEGIDQVLIDGKIYRSVKQRNAHPPTYPRGRGTQLDLFKYRTTTTKINQTS